MRKLVVILCFIIVFECIFIGARRIFFTYDTSNLKSGSVYNDFTDFCTSYKSFNNDVSKMASCKNAMQFSEIYGSFCGNARILKNDLNKLSLQNGMLSSLFDFITTCEKEGENLCKAFTDKEMRLNCYTDVFSSYEKISQKVYTEIEALYGFICCSSDKEASVLKILSYEEYKNSAVNGTLSVYNIDKILYKNGFFMKAEGVASVPRTDKKINEKAILENAKAAFKSTYDFNECKYISINSKISPTGFLVYNQNTCAILNADGDIILKSFITRPYLQKYTREECEITANNYIFEKHPTAKLLNTYELLGVYYFQYKNHPDGGITTIGVDKEFNEIKFYA